MVTTPRIHLPSSSLLTHTHWIPSLVLRLWNTRIEIMQAWRAWYFFLTWPRNGSEFLEQKANVLHVVQPTLCLTFSVYDIHPPPIARYMKYPLPLLIFMFWAFGYVHAQLRSLYPLSTFDIRFSTATQLQCLCSGAWEPGNEATEPLYPQHYTGL